MAFLSFEKSIKVVRNITFGIIRSRLYKVPFWVHFYITRKCNLRCNYCSLYDNRTKDLDTQDVKRIVDKLYAVGIRGISFFGGEPTLRKDFCDILEYAVKKGIVAYFTTNGTLLNKEYIDRIGRTGVYFVEVSVDSLFQFDESKKDYTRSSKILAQLKESQKLYGFSVNTHLVITKKNLTHVIKTILHITDHGIPVTIGFLNHNTYNDQPDDESLFMETEEDKKRFCDVIDEIIDLKRKNIPVMDPFAYYHGMKDYIKGNKDWDCSAGKYAFAVDYDGSIQLCYALKPYNGINILDDDFDENFFKRPEIRQKRIKTQNWCTNRCFANCMHLMDNLIEHPVRSILFPNG